LLTNAITHGHGRGNGNRNSHCDGNSDFNRNGDSHGYGYCYRDSNVYTHSELDPTAYTHAKGHPGTENSANSVAAPVAGGDRLVERSPRRLLRKGAWLPRRFTLNALARHRLLVGTPQDFS